MWIETSAYFSVHWEARGILGRGSPFAIPIYRMIGSAKAFIEKGLINWWVEVVNEFFYGGKK
jgi:hypothetical protein